TPSTRRMAMDNCPQSGRAAALPRARSSFSRRLADLPRRSAGRLSHYSASRPNFRTATVPSTTSVHDSSAHCSAWDYRRGMQADFHRSAHPDFVSLVVGATGVYLAINHFAGKTWRRVPLKEVAIGFLFALGTVAAFGSG